MSFIYLLSKHLPFTSFLLSRTSLYFMYYIVKSLDQDQTVSSMPPDLDTTEIDLRIQTKPPLTCTMLFHFRYTKKANSVLWSSTLSQTNFCFNVSAVLVFWKCCGKRRNCNFSFFQSVYYLFGELSAIFIKLKIVICKLFQFGRV